MMMVSKKGQGAPPLFNDTGRKFSHRVNEAGVNDTNGNLPPVSMTPAVNLTPVANNGNNIRLLTS
jgi:hypothetical protein